ncbi:MAG: PKD domain-containing protein [Bacteroidota bacterium]|nr:PKD domain-containing protein [Bacteroidota bacterium]
MNKIGLFICFFGFSLAVKSQTADFTYATSNGLFCDPSTIQFTQNSTGNPIGFVWTFGNNTGSNRANPTVTYTNAGSYIVKLIVIYQQTTAVVTKTVVVNPAITASIGYDRNYICLPGVINFTGTSNGNISTYSWDFGDGSGTINTGNNTISHNFSSLGMYNIKLLATDVSGCFDSNSTVITVQIPPINGTAAPSSGCIPANVTFNGNVSVPANSFVTNYSWDFGDGSPPVSTSSNTTNHTYVTTGNFLPSVTIFTSEGCTNKYTFPGVAYGTPPTNLTTYAIKPVICGSDSAGFVSKAITANSYFWDFGDGSSTNVSDTIAQHKYNTLGVKNISVVPAYGGCPGNSGALQINVIGVIAKYNYSNTCTDKKTFSFNNISQGNLSNVSWDFGDGSPAVNTFNAIHTFPASGGFVTKLTVTDTITGCIDIYSQTIYTADPILGNPDSSVCKNASTTFSVTNSFNNPLTTYSWNVVGNLTGNLTDSNYRTNASSFGNFSNYVIILNGIQYCYDTIQLNHSILVKGPDLSFTAPSSLCLNSLYNVTNSSKPYIASDSIILWYWNFGVYDVNDTAYQPQPYLYSYAGGYKATLTAIDKNGCKDSLAKIIIINPIPFLYPIPKTDTLCSGKMDTLIVFHSDSIKWAPSNSLSCATCDTVLTSAIIDTKYYITATNQFSCTATDSISVKVYTPFTAVPISSNNYICLNDSLQLNVDPPGKKIIWSPTNTLSNNSVYGPIASPRQNTIYTATLIDSAGCFTSSTDINVRVNSLPTVDAGPDKIYPFNSIFSINPLYSNNIVSYNWSPLNLVGCSSCPNLNGVATSSNTFFISVTSDSGCIAKDSINIFIECKDANVLMPNAFTPNNDNINDYFYPLTRGIKSIIRFSIYDRFGKLVYEAKNFPPNSKAFGWNGQVKGSDQSTTTVYVYYVEALCDLGEKLLRKGSVVLIR